MQFNQNLSLLDLKERSFSNSATRHSAPHLLLNAQINRSPVRKVCVCFANDFCHFFFTTGVLGWSVKGLHNNILSCRCCGENKRRSFAGSWSSVRCNSDAWTSKKDNSQWPGTDEVSSSSWHGWKDSFEQGEVWCVLCAFTSIELGAWNSGFCWIVWKCSMCSILQVLMVGSKNFSLIGKPVLE